MMQTVLPDTAITLEDALVAQWYKFQQKSPNILPALRRSLNPEGDTVSVPDVGIPIFLGGVLRCVPSLACQDELQLPVPIPRRSAAYYHF